MKKIKKYVNVMVQFLNYLQIDKSDFVLIVLIYLIHISWFYV